jgi:hypothetical protein
MFLTNFTVCLNCSVKIFISFIHLSISRVYNYKHCPLLWTTRFIICLTDDLHQVSIDRRNDDVTASQLIDWWDRFSHVIRIRAQIAHGRESSTSGYEYWLGAGDNTSGWIPRTQSHWTAAWTCQLTMAKLFIKNMSATQRCTSSILERHESLRTSTSLRPLLQKS